MEKELNFYDVTIDSLTEKSDVPIRILMDIPDHPQANLLDYIFAKRGNASAMSVAVSCGITTLTKDMFDGTDRLYKHVLVATEHVKPFKNDQTRLFILYHELGHCCDDRTMPGKDVLEEVHRHTEGRPVAEATAYIEQLNEQTGLSGEFFADEFAAEYLGSRVAVQELRRLLKTGRVMVECLKQEYTEEVQRPVKERIRNIFRKRRELRRRRKAALLFTLKDIEKLAKQQGYMAA